MADKVLLNNELHSNKPIVKKAVIQIITKLIKRIKKLNGILQKAENSKIRIKHRKTIEILSQVKQIKHIDFLKSALLNKENKQHIITNGLSTPEDIAQAMLFMHKDILNVVSKIKKKLSLDDDDETWKDFLSNNSKRMQRKLKSKEYENRKLERDKRKELARCRKQWLDANSSNDIDKKSLEENSKIINFEKKNHSMKTKKKISTNLGINEQSIGKDDLNNSIDPFFITSCGQNYISSIPTNCSENKDDGWHIKNYNKKKLLLGNSKNPKTISKVTSRLKSNSKQINHENSKIKKEIILTKNAVLSKEKLKNNSDLHPSWAAKKNSKPLIAKFEGTKIKFDD